MRYGRLIGAAAAAWFVFIAYGFLVHGMLIAKDYLPHPEGVYRSAAATQVRMPIGMLGLFAAILVFAIMYVKIRDRMSGSGKGPRLGLTFGVFVAGAFVATNYATLEISGKLALELAVSALVEWTIVGTVVAAVYGSNAGKSASGKAG